MWISSSRITPGSEQQVGRWPGSPVARGRRRAAGLAAAGASAGIAGSTWLVVAAGRWAGPTVGSQPPPPSGPAAAFSAALTSSSVTGRRWRSGRTGRSSPLPTVLSNWSSAGPAAAAWTGGEMSAKVFASAALAVNTGVGALDHGQRGERLAQRRLLVGAGHELDELERGVLVLGVLEDRHVDAGDEAGDLLAAGGRLGAGNGTTPYSPVFMPLALIELSALFWLIIIADLLRREVVRPPWCRCRTARWRG